MTTLSSIITPTNVLTATNTVDILNKTLVDAKISANGTTGEIGQALISQGANLAPIWGNVSTASTSGAFGITINGGGTAITTGMKGYVTIPYNCNITGWTLIADVSGSIVVDLWKDTYTNYPPTVTDTITGTEKPTLSSSIKNQDLSLTTWTTSVTAGDIIAFNVDSASTVTSVNLTINVTKV